MRRHGRLVFFRGMSRRHPLRILPKPGVHLPLPQNGDVLANKKTPLVGRFKQLKGRQVGEKAQNNMVQINKREIFLFINILPKEKVRPIQKHREHFYGGTIRRMVELI